MGKLNGELFLVRKELAAAHSELSFNRALVAKAGDDITQLLKDTLEIEAERDTLRNLLSDILNHSVANRGTEGAFFRCHTYRTGEMPEWVKRAEKAICQQG